MRKSVARGHVSLFARGERREADGGRDEEQFLRVRGADPKAADQLVLGSIVDVGAILRLPNVIAVKDDESPERRPSWLQIVELALVALDQMRTAETRA
jgi:hypothetical protein